MSDHSEDSTPSPKSPGDRARATRKRLLNHRGAVVVDAQTIEITSMGIRSIWKLLGGVGNDAMFQQAPEGYTK